MEWKQTYCWNLFLHIKLIVTNPKSSLTFGERSKVKAIIVPGGIEDRYTYLVCFYGRILPVHNCTVNPDDSPAVAIGVAGLESVHATVHPVQCPRKVVHCQKAGIDQTPRHQNSRWCSSKVGTHEASGRTSFQPKQITENITNLLKDWKKWSSFLFFFFFFIFFRHFLLPPFPF